MPERPAVQRAITPRLQDFMERERERVDAALGSVLPAADLEPPNLHRAMRHSVFAGGKRLRPMLVIGGGRACGAEPDAVMAAACAVELIHTYSLIHDDLPSFDDEQLRRGQPTCHVLFGDAVAVLAGDALQALAFEHLAAAAAGSPTPDRSLEAIRIIARAAGSIGMCGGQTLDVEAVGATIDLPALRRLHAAKTGALLIASVTSGGVLAGADDQQIEALRRYGAAVGLAFQIVDDLLDVEGDVERLGKQPGGDADRDQPTFPALIGVEPARIEARRLRDEAIDVLALFGDHAEILRDLAAYIVDRSW